MWAVTVTGAPKTWAMQFIEDHEKAPRRWYGGAVGMIGFDGGMNTGLTLRTAHIEHGVAAVRAGATLLFDSDPAAEETRDRAEGAGAAGNARRRRRCRLLLLPNAPGGRPPPAPRTRRPALTCGCCSSTTRTRSCTRWPATSPSRAPRSPTLRAGFPAAALDDYRPDLVVLSPGPGRPSDFGCDALLTELDTRGLPAFGVCLGLQAMVEHAGRRTGAAGRARPREAGHGTAALR